MALAAPFTGEVELDAIMDLIEPVTGVDNADEAVYLGLVAAVVRATERAQASGLATNRLGERIGPHTASLIMALTSWAPHAVREFRALAGLTNVVLDAASGEAQDFVNLGPVH